MLNSTQKISAEKATFHSGKQLIKACYQGQLNQVTELLVGSKHLLTENILLSSYEAACSGQHPEIANLIQNNLNDFLNPQKLQVAMYFCTQNGFVHSLDLLFQKERQTISNMNYSIMILLAVNNNQPHTLRYLLSKLELDEYSSAISDCFVEAAAKGLSDIVQVFLDSGIDLKSEKRLSSIRFASRAGHTEVLMKLLDKKFDQGIPLFPIRQIFLLAAENGHVPILELLFKKRQSLISLNTIKTAQKFAANQEQIHVLKFLGNYLIAQLENQHKQNTMEWSSKQPILKFSMKRDLPDFVTQDKNTSHNPCRHKLTKSN